MRLMLWSQHRWQRYSHKKMLRMPHLRVKTALVRTRTRPLQTRSNPTQTRASCNKVLSPRASKAHRNRKKKKKKKAAATVTHRPAAAVDASQTSGPRAQGDRRAVAVAVVVVVVPVVVLAVALRGVQTAEVPRAAVAIVAATAIGTKAADTETGGPAVEIHPGVDTGVDTVEAGVAGVAGVAEAEAAVAVDVAATDTARRWWPTGMRCCPHGGSCLRKALSKCARAPTRGNT